MERNPSFFMESVVQGREAPEDFEGPLTLLLQLVSKNKVAIHDIQIGALCDQYIAHLGQMQEMDLEVASEFVQLASHLLYLKSRSLLSVGEEIPELELLIQSMEELKCKAQLVQIQGIMEEFSSLSLHGGGYLEKPPEYIERGKLYQHQHHVLSLLEALGRVFIQQGLDITDAEPPKLVMPKAFTYSVSQKADEIIRHLKRRGTMTAMMLFGEAKSRSEIVATFIALLELCKVGSLHFEGDGADLALTFTGIEPEEGSIDDHVLGGEEDGA